MDRRGFLGSILLAAVAPAIVRADSLMRIVPMDTLVAPSVSAMTAAELVALDDMLRDWQDVPLALERFSELVIRPAMLALNERYERDMLRLARCVA